MEKLIIHLYKIRPKLVVLNIILCLTFGRGKKPKFSLSAIAKNQYWNTRIKILNYRINIEKYRIER